MQRPEGCLAFFWWFLLFLSLDCSCAGFSLGSGGSHFLAVSSLVASTTTVQTKIIVETSLMFFSQKLTFSTQLIRNGGSRCRWLCQLVVVTAGRSRRIPLGGITGRSLRFLFGLLWGLVVLLGGWFSRTRFLVKPFPVTGVYVTTSNYIKQQPVLTFGTEQIAIVNSREFKF